MARTCIENAIFLITSRQICLKNRNLCTYRQKYNLPASQGGRPSSAHHLANRRLTDIPAHTVCRSPIDAAAGQAGLNTETGGAQAGYNAPLNA